MQSYYTMIALEVARERQEALRAEARRGRVVPPELPRLPRLPWARRRLALGAAWLSRAAGELGVRLDPAVRVR